MSWQPAPPRPVLYINASPEAEEARALLEEYDIDFETRSTDGPAVTLRWSEHTFTDIFGITGSAGAPKDGASAPR